MPRSPSQPWQQSTHPHRQKARPDPVSPFEAIERLDNKEQRIIRELLEGMIVKYEARRWTQAS